MKIAERRILGQQSGTFLQPAAVRHFGDGQ